MSSFQFQLPYSRCFKTKPQASSMRNPTSTTHTHEEISKTGVIVVGGGLAGLAAATHLKANQIPFLLIESSNAIGGRVRTDTLNGFLLDRGFQIFLTSYPEARKLLDYKALKLRNFYSGALIYSSNSQFHTLSDPFRHFWDSLSSLSNSIGSLSDKLLIALTRINLLLISDHHLLTSPNDLPTFQLLKNIGFSDSIISQFFRPFFGGIFFDTDLQTSSRLFNFIFKCLSLGHNALPSNGIGSIPHQLAANLPPEAILLNSTVISIESPFVKLHNGNVVEAKMGVIVAAEEPEAARLLNRPSHTLKQPARSTVCVYFSADPSGIPVKEAVLVLNGSGKGIVNNMFFPTNVAPSYAPPDKALVSVSLVGKFEDATDDDLTAEVLRELSGWFGESTVETWRHLRTYRIGYAQPNQCPPSDFMKNPKVDSGVYVCGDYLTSATFDGALVSGRRAVEALIRDKAALLA